MFDEFSIGPITIHMYGVMFALGFISALKICEVRAKKKNLSDDIVWGLFIGAIVGGLLGARLLYYIVEFKAIMKDISILWNFTNGYVVYGGIIGGVLVDYLYCRYKKVNFMKYFDLVMPSVAFAQGLGRIGCFLAGCCYGRETTSFIGITYTTSKIAPNGVKLIPTQLISSAGDFLFAFLLILYDNKCKEKKDGSVAYAYFALYSIGRFVIEFFRNDYRGSIGFLSTSQIISMGIFIIGAGLFVKSRFVKKEA